MTPRQKLESQCKAMIVSGLAGTCAAYTALVLGLPRPWNLWVATPLAVLSLATSFYGLWRWHVYERDRLNIMIVTDGSDHDGPLTFPKEFAQNAAAIHSAPTPAEFIRAGERAMKEEIALETTTPLPGDPERVGP